VVPDPRKREIAPAEERVAMSRKKPLPVRMNCEVTWMRSPTAAVMEQASGVAPEVTIVHEAAVDRATSPAVMRVSAVVIAVPVGAVGVPWVWSPRAYSALTPALAACPNVVSVTTVSEATPVPAPATAVRTNPLDAALLVVSGEESLRTRSPVMASPALLSLRGSPLVLV
jgi:hypothetical protein